MLNQWGSWQQRYAVHTETTASPIDFFIMKTNISVNGRCTMRGYICFTVSTPKNSQQGIWIKKKTGHIAKIIFRCALFCHPPAIITLRNRP